MADSIVFRVNVSTTRTARACSRRRSGAADLKVASHQVLPKAWLASPWFMHPLTMMTRGLGLSDQTGSNAPEQRESKHYDITGTLKHEADSFE